MTKVDNRNRWFVAGHPSYAVTHLIPLAYAHLLRYGRPLSVLGFPLAEACKSPSLVKSTKIRTHLLRRETAVCLDIPSLIKMRALGFPCILLYHSLIGKGKMLRGERQYWPLFLAKNIIIAGDNQYSSLPKGQQYKAYVCGHLPNDWLGLPETLLGEEHIEVLRRWRGSARPRVLFVSTRGSNEVPEMVGRIFEWFNVADATVAVKWHPGESSYRIPPGTLSVNGIPVPILAKNADCVVGDHSSAILEAQSAGAMVAVIETLFLRRLMAVKPPLKEVAYVDYKIPVLSQSNAVADFITQCYAKVDSMVPKQAASIPASHRILNLLEELI